MVDLVLGLLTLNLTQEQILASNIKENVFEHGIANKHPMETFSQTCERNAYSRRPQHETQHNATVHKMSHHA